MNKHMKRVLYQAASWLAVLGGGVALLIAVVTMVNVGGFAIDKIARLFGSSFPSLLGYEDFVSLAISSAALMFFPYCQTRYGHVAVDVFMKLFPDWFGRVVDIVSAVLMMILALFLGYMMTKGVIEVRDDNTMSAILGWQVWPFYVPGIISMFLWALICATQIFESEPDV
jgi:TRAP-type C4-dicarboxylate transport system permease small subunit